MHELTIEATLSNIDAVMEFINTHIENCPPTTRNKIEIAVDEIFSNIARYAYHPKTGAATVRVAVNSPMQSNGGDITIEFEDGGTAFNPLAKDDLDVSLPPEKRGAGGLGIFLVKNIMDSVEYRRDGDKNIIAIKKKI